MSKNQGPSKPAWGNTQSSSEVKPSAWGKPAQGSGQGSQPAQNQAKPQPQAKPQGINQTSAVQVMPSQPSQKKEIEEKQASQPQFSQKSVVFEKQVEEEKKELQHVEVEQKAANEIQHLSRSGLGVAQANPKQNVFQMNTNFYPVEIKSGAVAYHYDVSFIPEMKNKNKTRALFNDLVKKSEVLSKIGCAYDGKSNLFTSQKIVGAPLNINFKIKSSQLERLLGNNPTLADKLDAEDPGKDIVVKIKEADNSKIALDSLGSAVAESDYQKSMQALDVVFLEFFSNPDLFITMGHKFFSKNDLAQNQVNLGYGATCWTGNFASAHSTQMGLTLQVDIAAIVMWEEMLLIDYLKLMLGSQWMNNLVAVDKLIRKLKIQVLHRTSPQSMIIKGLSDKAANLDKFEVEDPVTKKVSQTDVATYFQSKYQKLKFPNLPCVVVGSTNMKIPLEVCKIARAEKYEKELNLEQRTKMLDCTRVKPSERLERTELAPIMKKFNSSSLFESFGITVSTKRIEVQAKLLSAPKVKYGNGTVNVKDGAGEWSRDSTDKTFIDPVVTCKKVVCVNYASREINRDDAARFFADQVRKCADHGMKLVIEGAISQCDERDIPQQLAFLKQLSESNKPDIIFIILPKVRGFFYNNLKKMCELELGQSTQCFSALKAAKANGTYFQNCAFKICAKLGGVVHSVDELPLKNRSTMFIGADVYHPPPFSDDCSIAAICGSYDASATKYSTEICYQKGRTEVILNMREAAYNLLRFYATKNNGKLPAQIVFFRDGVASTAFDQTISEEVGAIKAAATKLSPQAKILVTYVNVQKRHHAFLTPIGKNFADRMGNPLAGSVVDSVICDPRDVDFYLYSHAAIIGTSRGCHNHLLVNDGAYTLTEIQNLTYRLSYLYQRCGRSVSIPAPVYYAHHAASRAKFYLGNDNSSISSDEINKRRNNKPFKITGPKVHANIKGKLYFC